MNMNNFEGKIVEIILARRLGELLQTFKSHLLEFMAQMATDQPNTFVVCLQQGKKFVMMSMAYSDDQELMDKVTTEVDELITKRFTDRYPELLEHVGEDHRGEER